MRLEQLVHVRVPARIRDAGDGGGLQVLGLTNNTLTVRYQGACGTCPSSIAGTLMAIENMIKEEIDPEIEVVAV